MTECSTSMRRPTEAAQRLLDGKGILGQADEGADEQSADLAAAHQGKVDSDE